MPYYVYNGPVFIFDKCAREKWNGGTTFAKTPEKAKSNLCYRYKKQYGLRSDCKVTLPGKIRIKEGV